MKKLITTFGAFLLLCQLYAQTDMYFGLKAGFNLSTQKVDNPAASYSMRPGFNGGAIFYFSFPNFVIQPEVIFSNQGTNITWNDEKLYAVFNYVSIPILFKYVLKKSGISIGIGPQLGFLLCNKSNYHPITNEKYDEQHYTTAYKSTDFLLAFGLGWDSEKNWLVDVRYSLGLISINDYNGIPDTKNRVISINVAYRLVKLNK